MAMVERIEARQDVLFSGLNGGLKRAVNEVGQTQLWLIFLKKMYFSRL